MKTIRTIKIKFSGNHKANKILPNWLDACNWLSKIVFDSKEINSNRLSRSYYKTVRDKFNLPSQLTCTLFRTVSATYKTQKTNKEWNFCTYKNQSIPVVWKRDFARNKKGVTLWADLVTFNDTRIIPDNWKDSKIFLKKKQWFLNLSYEIDIPHS